MPAAKSQPSFDPSQHLRKLQGNDYLDVKWRIAWLRDVHPNANVVTDLYAMTQDYAVFKCIATLDTGATATGWGSEERKDFKDYIEKAETKAIGRALALLGFGTQFADDFADGSSGRIADAPVQRPAPGPHTQIDGAALRESIVNESKANEDTPERRQKGLAAVFAAGTAKGLKSDDVKRIAYAKFKVRSMTALTAVQLSDFWKYLNAIDQEDLIDELASATVMHPEVNG